MRDVQATSGNLRWGSVAAVCLLSWALFRFLSIEWSVNPQYSYGWGVPLLAVYLFSKRWKDRPEPEPNKGRHAFILLATALAIALLPIRILLEANPDWRALLWPAALGYTIALSLWIWWAGGRAWVSHFAVPVVFILLAVPWPSPVEQELVQSLTRGISALTVECMRWFGIPSVARGNLIHLAGGVVDVNNACSGIRSFQTTLMMSIFFGELHRLSLPSRLTLLGLGLVWTIALNFIRTATLTWITAVKGAELQTRAHDSIGLAVLIVSVAGVVALATWLARGTIRPEAHAPLGSARWPRTAIIVALVAWLVTVEIITEAWFRAQEGPLQTRTTWTVAWPRSASGFTEQPLGDEIQSTLRSDESSGGLWRREDGAEWTMFFIKWLPGRMAEQFARGHSPEICLPAVGFELVEKKSDIIISANGLDLPFEVYTFLSGREVWHVFFCVAEDWAPRKGDSNADKPDFARELGRKRRLLLAWEGRRHFGQQVLEIAMTGYESSDAARRALEQDLHKIIQVED